MKIQWILATSIILLVFTCTLSADVFLSTTNSQFNFDTDGSGAGFELSAQTQTSPVNALEDISVWIQYLKNTDPGGTAPTVQQVFATGGSMSSSTSGSVTFDNVLVDFDPNGSGKIAPTIEFTLSETSPGLAFLEYSLNLSGENFAEQVDLQAFVGFDYLGTGNDSATITPNFGDVSIFENGFGTLFSGLGNDASAMDVYDATSNNPMLDDARFDGVNDFAATGSNLAIGHLFDYSIQPSGGFQTFDVTFDGFVGVPEPSMIGGCLIGLLGLTTRRRRNTAR